MRTPGIVGDEVIVQHLLHFVNGLEPCAPAFDTEVFIEECAVEALDNAVGLRALDACGAVFDVFELQVEFVRMPVGPSAELAAIVRQHNLDFRCVFLEGGDHIVVHGVDGCDGEF